MCAIHATAKTYRYLLQMKHFRHTNYMQRQTERDLLNPKSYFINTIGTLKGQCQEICYLPLFFCLVKKL